jgi:hypothetical protein
MSVYNAKSNRGAVLATAGATLALSGVGIAIVWIETMNAYAVGRLDVLTALKIALGFLFVLAGCFLAVSGWNSVVLEISISEECLIIHTGSRRMQVGWQGIRIERYGDHSRNIRIAISIPTRSRPIILQQHDFGTEIERIWAALEDKVQRRGSGMPS